MFACSDSIAHFILSWLFLIITVVEIDGEDVTNLNLKEITEIMMEKQNQERLLTVITSMYTESSKSVGTV